MLTGQASTSQEMMADQPQSCQLRYSSNFNMTIGQVYPM